MKKYENKKVEEGRRNNIKGSERERCREKKKGNKEVEREKVKVRNQEKGRGKTGKGQRVKKCGNKENEEKNKASKIRKTIIRRKREKNIYKEIMREEENT